MTGRPDGPVDAADHEKEKQESGRFTVEGIEIRYVGDVRKYEGSENDTDRPDGPPKCPGGSQDHINEAHKQCHVQCAEQEKIKGSLVRQPADSQCGCDENQLGGDERRSVLPGFHPVGDVVPVEVAEIAVAPFFGRMSKVEEDHQPRKIAVIGDAEGRWSKQLPGSDGENREGNGSFEVEKTKDFSQANVLSAG